ncbi:MAG: hypothetical protein HC792_01555 [Acaryochloridaceae cyanobacterium CSU_5_19]|nr:hypothetical protein [Acaryochloridaceae cyanobacterium CSU_5_19]
MLFDKTITFYEQVLRLPPAHSLIVGLETLELNCYWELDPNYELRLESDAAYVEQFRAIFTEAVHCRLRSAFPIGTMLSGGLDSSSITCTATQLLEQSHPKGGGSKLPTFTAVFNEITASDEQDYIQAVIAQGQINPM